MSLDQPYDRRYFEQAYRDYARQNPPRKMAFYRGLAVDAAGALPTPRLLDLGCAFGTFLSGLNPAWALYGMDVSAYAVRRARERLPKAQLVLASAMEIPFQASFDVITAFDVLEHLEDLDRAARSIASRLAPTGRLIFVVPVYDGPLGPVVRALDRDVTHRHRESRTFWLAWAGRHFNVIRWYGVVRYLLPGGFYLHWSTRLARRWTPAIAVLAQCRP